MRGAFIRGLVELAESDPRVVLLTGDLGYTVIEAFADRFPERFFNAGVAEQNMVGVATGLADAGLIPFVYSIATFAALRAYEFIRNGPIVHQHMVRIAGVGGGFEYGPAGMSHYAVEDVAVMRVQPGMRVICPADDQQAAAALRATWDLPGPAYYALTKNDIAPVAGLDGRFQLGRAHVIGSGIDMLLIAMGGVVGEAIVAAQALGDRGVGCTLVVVSSVSPAPIEDLAEVLARFRLAMTIESQYIMGGLGSLVAEIIADHGLACRTTRCGLRSTPTGVTGSEHFLMHRHGLSSQALTETALRIMDSSG